MYPTRNRKPVLITVVTVANVAVGADAGTVKQWRRCKTIEREAAFE